MPRFLLDTNICIYIRQKRPPEVFRRFERLKRGDAALSVVTYGELLYGAYKSSQTEVALSRLAELIALLPVLELPVDAAREYGEVRSGLERKGQIIGGNDLWIAAHARVASLIIVTNDAREFKRVPGLKVENWVSAT